MPISLQCPECDKKLKVADTAAGKKIRCPGCKSSIAVPAPEEEFEQPDEGFETPDEETAVTATPRNSKKSGISKGEPPVKKRKDDDEDDEEEDERPRKKKKKRRYDDEDDDEDGDIRSRRRGRGRRREVPHRGSTVLTLGILSMVVCCAPVLAWILAASAINMANQDLAQMDRGRMDEAGRGSTQTGKICAFVGIGLGVVGLVLIIVDRVLQISGI